MHPLIYLPLLSLAVVCVIMACAWVWGIRLNNYSIVDAFWSFNFAVIALIILFFAHGLLLRKEIVCLLAVFWSLRLGMHLSRRIFSHLSEEEGRYKQLRKEWKKNLHTRFFFFYQMQAASNVWLCIPFFIIAVNENSPMRRIEFFGAAVWLVSIIGEAVADKQLDDFKKNPANKGLVCNTGLWNYSRHPNYFFQLMIWIGVFIFALGSPHGWLAVVSPLSIAFLLFKVTGIPMTEEQSLRSKGQKYREYQKETSAFIPWIKKKGS